MINLDYYHSINKNEGVRSVTCIQWLEENSITNVCCHRVAVNATEFEVMVRSIIPWEARFSQFTEDYIIRNEPLKSEFGVGSSEESPQPWIRTSVWQRPFINTDAPQFHSIYDTFYTLHYTFRNITTHCEKQTAEGRVGCGRRTSSESVEHQGILSILQIYCWQTAPCVLANSVSVLTTPRENIGLQFVTFNAKMSTT